ncbi:MAG: ArsR/SmtB family transcription factor [Thermoleophilaceae bacterium]
MTADRCDLLCLDLALAERLRDSLDLSALNAPAERARALGDPTRLAAALALYEGEELCVCDLAWVLGRAENLVSHHLRVLRQGGLACSRREGKMVLYRLTDDGAALVRALVPNVREVIP